MHWQYTDDATCHLDTTLNGIPVQKILCFGPNDCVVHNSGIGPKTFQTRSIHQTSAVSEYASVW